MVKFGAREYKVDVSDSKGLEDDDTLDDAEYAYLKSRALMDRNMNQMIGVLHGRLAALESAAKFRMELLAEDLQPNSKKDSKQAPKITEENEAQFMNRIKSDMRNSTKDVNLVSADGILIDPVRLLLKTKPPTETAKKLESRIEDLLSSSNREMKGKKGKKAARTERSKESEHKKSEEKRAKKHQLEKALTEKIEDYIMRSVLEPGLIYRVPPDPMHGTMEILTDEFPITVKWSPKNYRSAHQDNADGEMDPDVILRYAMERISLASGHLKMFRILLHKNVSHEYFVYLFWFVKVKFFQKQDSEAEERFLLKQLSDRYVEIVRILTTMTHTQHEKDFFFTYFPYIMCNAVYFTFFYLCPGSRHLYTKGFRKTILMQIVQVLFGIQLCPISVKVTWARLFPDDAHDDFEEGEENIQLPMPIALPGVMVPGLEATSQGAGAGLDSAEASPVASARKASTAVGASAGRTGPGGSPNSAAASAKFPGLLVGDDIPATTRPPLSQLPSHLFSVDGGSLGSSRDASDAVEESPVKETGGELKLRAGGHLNPVVDPLERVDLSAAPEKPEKQKEALRQKRGALDAFYMSPIMQQYLGAPVASTRRRQKINRTTPINWCAAGGTDTYRKAAVPRELHDELSRKARTFRVTARKQSLQHQKEQLLELKQIELNCQAVIDGGTTSIGRVSIDIIKRQKSQKTVSRGGTVIEAPFVNPFPDNVVGNKPSSSGGDVDMQDKFDDKDSLDEDDF
jgi:hypothetical protein